MTAKAHASRSRQSRARGARGLETVVPLYVSNVCDSTCRICNMRRDNHRLRRRVGTLAGVVEQLAIIRDVEGIHAVCFLTGELQHGSARRSDNLAFVQECIAAAFSRGFQKVYFNIGSLGDEEIQTFRARFSTMAPLVLALFQETYDPSVYARFFGRDGESSPKANFALRLSTPERWVAAGFPHVNVGILLGLGPVEPELDAVIVHVRRLESMGADVAVSLPRLRGLRRDPVEVTDAQFVAIVERLARACPRAKLVISTRESLEVIRSVLHLVRVITPGTSDVLPYPATGPVPNSIWTSQFHVQDWRPRPSWTLRALGLAPGQVGYFTPPGQ